MDIRIILYVLGRISMALGMVLTLNAVVSIVCQDDGLLALAGAALVSFAVGMGMQRSRKGAIEDLSVREGIAITSLSWILVTFLGMLPYVFGGYLNILDGILECISGLSGTGATVITDIEVLPQSLLVWRSLTHWLGGLGIIVIFIALFPQFGHGIVHMMDAESTGPTSDRMLPRVRQMAKALFTVYVVLTTAATVALMACGLDFLTALEHAFSTIATGGFSPYNDSVAHFNSPLIEGVLALFMILSSANFSIYVAAWRKGIGVIFRDTEFRLYVALVLGASALMSLNLTYGASYDPLEAVRETFFQAASISSSTGFVSADFDQWPSFSKGILLFLMFCGGCAGSTAGGLKVTRLMLLMKTMRSVVQQKLSPRSVVQVHSNGEDYNEEILYGVARFFVAYVILDILWTVLFIGDGVPTLDAIGLSVSTMGSCGPAFGTVGPTCTYAELPVFSKVIVCISMLMGRLEMFPVLALLMPSFWRHSNW
ncbi:TrkH family potassium uptake protein [Megasphaera sp. AM44-1BH]|jgi:trk system potassium uptake protein TrkH|uniref:TrkH family potassium uptake protein n=1 Tax=Megasphaera sp. AM44-1BH TaxID=2292358 RepID=UPI000E509D46|nr:TrkH family potassium uptake protein [Megasphaera sp. AM44-1BH]RHA15015.1 TrkH family potassium uptake protein [Megasphaera sp. AM44-1BH]